MERSEKSREEKRKENENEKRREEKRKEVKISTRTESVGVFGKFGESFGKLIGSRCVIGL